MEGNRKKGEKGKMKREGKEQIIIIVKAGPLACQAKPDRVRVESPPKRECQALALCVEATQN